MKTNNVYRKTNKCAHQLALLVVFSDIKMNVHFNVTFLSMIQEQHRHHCKLKYCKFRCHSQAGNNNHNDATVKLTQT